MADLKCSYAVSMRLIVIGENAARLVTYHPEFIADHPETPWSQAIGIRNRTARGYDELEFSIVFPTVTEYPPELLRNLPASKPIDDCVQLSPCTVALLPEVRSRDVRYAAREFATPRGLMRQGVSFDRSRSPPA